MKQQQWLKLSLILSIILLGASISSEQLFLNRPYRYTPHLKLPSAPELKKDSLAFWEATLTGNARPLSKDRKEKLKALGLAHIYTPSGLHLSLILNPVFLFLKSNLLRFILLGSLFAITGLFLPGMLAVKRMMELKLVQTVGKSVGIENRYTFLVVMFFDLIFGTYLHSPLSFCFSFLFLSLIYARMNFLVAAWWYFIAQVIIAIFLEQSFFITNILWTPLLTILFSGLFPALIFFRLIPNLSFLGEILSRFYLSIIDFVFELSSFIPRLEANPFLFIILGLLLFGKYRCFILGVILFSSQLNFDQNRYQTQYLARKYYYVSETGKGCRLEGGFEKCSYRSRSTKNQL